MATKAHITSAFIAKLLAPIPAGEEQADTKKYWASLQRTEMAVWVRSMSRVKYFEAQHKMAALSIVNALDHKAHISNGDAYRQYRMAIERQCLVAAPTAVEARWKRRMMKGHTMPQDVSDAIEADDARFGA